MRIAVVLMMSILTGPFPAHAQDPPSQERDGAEMQDERPQQRDARQQRRRRAAPLRLPTDVEHVPDVVFATVHHDDGETRDLMMDVFFPKQSGDAPLPAIIYIHGGGWTDGDRFAGSQFSALLASGGYLTATIDYRLLGEAKFPAALEDVKGAVRFLRANAQELGVDPERIGVWGHSAGGHLAAWLGATGNAPETDGSPGEPGVAHASCEVACVVDFFGPSDLAALMGGRNGARLRRAMVGDGEESQDMLEHASPASWVDGEDPPFLIIHGTRDNVVPIEQSERLDAALREAGVETELIRVEGAGHGIRDIKYMLNAASFFDRHLKGAAEPVFQSISQAQTDRAPDGGSTGR